MYTAVLANRACAIDARAEGWSFMEDQSFPMIPWCRYG
jgi:hypothetical protein